MPDDEPDSSEAGPSISGYGIGSAVVGVIAIAAIVLAALIWTRHRDDTEELRYRTRAMQAAADWTSVLINMNSDTVDASLAQLHESTVGQLNADFDSALKPYRELVQKLRSRTSGQVDSVAIEQVHRPQPGTAGQPPPVAPELAEFASRTDTVMVVATSVSENAGSDQPQTVRWTLRLDVADIDGKPMISRLEPIR
jgi:FtsZ-interacting cell division protein ZipA